LVVNRKLLTMCYFSIKSGEGGVGGQKVVPRRLLCSQPKAKRVGENVSLIMNQEKMTRSDNWLHSYEP
jgi:hypothetical protein